MFGPMYGTVQQPALQMQYQQQRPVVQMQSPAMYGTASNGVLPVSAHAQSAAYVPQTQPQQAMTYAAQPVVANSSNKQVLVENLPLSTQLETITDFFKQMHSPAFPYGLSVRRAKMEYDASNPNATWCYAHLEFVTSTEAMEVVRVAEEGNLLFMGRQLIASLETQDAFAATTIGSSPMKPPVLQKQQELYSPSHVYDPRPRFQSLTNAGRAGRGGGGRGRGRGRGGRGGRFAGQGGKGTSGRDERHDRPY